MNVHDTDIDSMASPDRTLIAHEWLAPVGGSENVFEELTKVLPHVDTACLWNDAPERFPAVTYETWLAGSPLRRSKAMALPAMHSAWRRIPLDGYSRVITSSHAFAHHLATRAAKEGVPSYAYVHTPARYIWDPTQDHRGRSRFVKAAAGPLRRLDRRESSPDVSYAANSRYIQNRIRDAWDRDSTVIYPPVDVAMVQSSNLRANRLGDAEIDILTGLPENFVLGASRLVRYKRLDKVVEVGRHLDLPVVIAGGGPDETRLRHLARDSRVPVFFLGRVSTPVLHELYHRATLFVFVSVEDFGIMPVEAMAAGTPVLVNQIGGSREAVHITGGGMTVDLNGSMSSLSSAASYAAGIDMTSPAAKTSAFSVNSFRNNVRAWIYDD